MENENTTEETKPSQATPKTKKIAYKLISSTEGEGPAMYAEIRRLISAYHPDLVQARIALAFNVSWKPDVDGRLKLGVMKVASDLDRELSEFDLVIVLSEEFWKDEKVTDEQREALLDHELTHGALQRAKNLEPIEDEKGRKCYRIRKHDIEEFSQVVERHGVWKKDLEQFARALKKGRQRELFDRGENEEPIGEGGDNVTAQDDKGEIVHISTHKSSKDNSELEDLASGTKA